MILGPADAAHFRVKVGRYGDRWYCDPLPGDDIAPATDATWPAFSIVKKASGKDWSYVTIGRIAGADWDRMANLPEGGRYDTLVSINKRGLDVATGRGTILHWWGDDMLHGREPREVTELDLMAYKLPRESLEQAKVYLPAFRLFFDTYQPELVATEYPAIHRTLNGVGYGCTPDGLMRIEGDVVGYDFKSRTPGGDHAAYPEEGGQIAAGLCADYMIVEGEGGSVRREIPALTSGLVISIKPDGVRLFPIDIVKAWNHFEAMHAWWVARRNERDAIGRPLPVRTTYTADDMTRPTAPRSDVIDEGEPITNREYNDLKYRYEHLDTADRGLVQKIIAEAAAAGLPFALVQQPAQRRHAINRALISWLEVAWDEDVIRDLLGSLIDSDLPRQPGVPLGAVFGALTITEARQLADMAGLVADGATLEYKDRWVITQTA